MLTLTFHGFHGRNKFNLRTKAEQIDGDYYLIDLTPAQQRRINNTVGCKKGCQCGESVKDFSSRFEIDEINTISIHVRQLSDTHYEYRGRYPQWQS